MAVIPAEVTDDARVYLPQMWGGLVTFKEINLFKVGIGGWIDPGTGAERRTPVSDLRRLDNGLQDIDIIVDPTRAVLDQRYAPIPATPSFSKALSCDAIEPSCASSYIAPVAESRAPALPLAKGEMEGVRTSGNLDERRFPPWFSSQERTNPQQELT